MIILLLLSLAVLAAALAGLKLLDLLQGLLIADPRDCNNDG